MTFQMFDIVKKINSLPVGARYHYFINEVTRTGQVYIAKDSDALSVNYSGGESVPLWTAPEFVQASIAHLDYPDMVPVSIPVKEFIDEFVRPPYDGIWAAVMCRSDGQACIVEWEFLVDDLRNAQRNTLGAMLEKAEEENRSIKSFQDLMWPIIKKNMKVGPKGKLPG